MRTFFRFAILTFALLFFTIGCENDEQTAPPKTKASEASGHQRMVSMLDSIGKKANPRENYHLNLLRAEGMKAMAEKEQDINKRLNLAYRYSLQMMYGGKADEAISVMETVMKTIGGFEAELTDKNVTIFKKLALGCLRKGELDNCVQNHTSASCIFPLQQDGFHTLKTGSENAIRIYTKILKKYPNDLESTYLLNVAYMTLGQYPGGVPTKYKLPKAMFNQKGSLASFPNIAVEMGTDVNGIAGGCCVEDFDNDGLLDIMATSYMYGDQIAFFRNDGKGGFDNKTSTSGLAGITGGLNTIHADYNNDGFQDVLVLRGGWLGLGGKQPNSLLKNNGNGTFTDVTIEAGLLSFFPTQTAVWTDVNRDGWLDLFIGNETGTFKDEPGTQNIDHAQFENPCELYLNNQNGTFREAARAAGLNFTGFVKGVAVSDINHDGWPDFYISILNGPNRLFVNRSETRDKLVFEDIAAKAGVQEPFQSFPTWFWDYDNDGYDDIFVAGYDLTRMSNVPEAYVKEWRKQNPETEMPRIYRNNGGSPGGSPGNETFTDMTASLKMNKVMFAMGCNYGDLDNDGFLDCYIGTGTPDLNSIAPNRMFRNVGGKYFEEVTNAGFGHIQKGHGVGFGDLDNDGDQDIYAVMGGAYQGDFAQNVLFENPGTSGNWVTLILEGTSTNKSAIGSRVQVIASGADGKQRSIFRTVSTGASFGANSLQLEIGIGKATQIDKVVIHWANAKNDAVEIVGIPIKKTIRIVEGKESAFEVVERQVVAFDKSQGHGHHH